VSNEAVTKFLKSRATVEDLLGLGSEGWMEIAKMNTEELNIYLKDVTELEPKFDPTSRPVVVTTEEEPEESDDNPIKATKKKKPKEPAIKSNKDLKSLFADLGVDL
jgi:hypothetical protein